MAWVAIGSAAGSIVGGLLSSKAGQKNQQNQQQLIDQQNKDYMANWQTQLAANRFNQSNPWGDLSWSQDPTTKAWTEKTTMNAGDQANLDSMRALTSKKLGAAGNIDLSQYSKPVNFHDPSGAMGSFGGAGFLGGTSGTAGIPGYTSPAAGIGQRPTQLFTVGGQ